MTFDLAAPAAEDGAGSPIYADGHPAPITLDEMRQRLIEVADQLNAINNQAQAEGRQLNDSESRELNELLDESERLDAAVQQQERLLASQTRLAERLHSERPTARAAREQGIVTDAPPVPVAHNAVVRPSVPATVDASARTYGFRNIGEFAQSVHRASAKGGHVDVRLMRNAPTNVSTEGAGPDGGFAVPPDFRATIMKQVMGDDAILPYTDQQFSSGSTFTAPLDETTPWGTAGVQAYWTGEARQIADSKITLANANVPLHTLTSLVNVSEQLNEDVPALDAYLRSKMPEVITWKINDALINGTGAGQPLGVLNSPALISVAKEASQANGTVRFRNILDMWSRCYAPWRRNAVWLINQEVEPFLTSMVLTGTDPAGTTATGVVPAYLPPGGLSGNQYGTLLGRPVIPTEACPQIGSVGDVLLFAGAKYLSVQKVGGPRTDVSMHLYFDYNLMSYRVTMRLGGQPWISAPIAKAKGSTTLSAFVAIAAR